MHLQQHHALPKKGACSSEAACFYPMHLGKSWRGVSGSFQQQGSKYFEKKKQKTIRIMTDWLFTHVEMEEQRSTAQPRSSWLDSRAGKSQAQVQSIALCSPIQLPRSEHSKRDVNLWIYILDFHFCFPHDVNRTNKHLSGAPETCLWATWTTPLLFPQ